MTPLSHRRARLAAWAVALVALAVGAGAPAWACVPQPFIVVQPRASGPAGTQVEVVGTNFDPGPAEIRWNALDGTLLAKAEGPGFSSTITVPDDVEGLYTLLALSRGPQGEVVGTARAAFALTGDAEVPSPQPPAPATAAEDRPRSSSPLGAMLLGAGLVAGGGVGGAALARRRRSR